MQRTMARETKKVWVTKYALTDGVFAVDAEIESELPRTAFVRGDRARGICDTCYHGKEWHLTRSCAIEQAERIRVKKIASLQKQIAQLEALKFDD